MARTKEQNAQYQRNFREKHPGYNYAAVKKNRATPEGRESYNQQMSDWTKDRRSKLSAIKVSLGCADCGEHFEDCPAILEFDHRPDTEKSFNIGRSIKKSWDAIIAEVEKCNVVCANCHRRRTIERLAEDD